jgi:hypothetical protein
VTPIEWKRGRLHETIASLLVFFAAQVLKWQEPVSAAGETICRIASGFKRVLLLSRTLTSSDRL